MKPSTNAATERAKRTGTRWTGPTLLVVLAAVVGTTVAVAGGTVAAAGGDAPASVQTADGDDTEPEFDENVYTADRGDSVDVTVSLGNDSVATFQAGSVNESVYHITAELIDQDGDGTVVVTFDTETAGSDQQVLSVSEGDSIRNVSQGGEFAGANEPVGSDTLAAGDYTLYLDAGNRTAAPLTQDNADTLATLSLSESQSDDSAMNETTPSSSTATTTETAPETETSDGSGPGFGIVGALVALVAAALVARRAE